MSSSRNVIEICSAEDDGTYTAEVPVQGGKEYNDPRHLPSWTLHVTGTFDSANVAVGISIDGGSTYVDVPDADTITAATVQNMQFRATHVRAVISGSVTAASLTVTLA